MPCELCGKEIRGCRIAIVDGAKMRVCPDCLRYAENYQEPVKTPTQVTRFLVKKEKKSVAPDIYAKMEKELVSNFADIIKRAREKKGLSREELGFRIGERTVTIQKIENGDLRPSDKMITKLEKELGITLLEDVQKMPTSIKKSPGLTLGDFIKKDF